MRLSGTGWLSASAAARPLSPTHPYPELTGSPGVPRPGWSRHCCRNEAGPADPIHTGAAPPPGAEAGRSLRTLPRSPGHLGQRCARVTGVRSRAAAAVLQSAPRLPQPWGIGVRIQRPRPLSPRSSDACHLPRLFPAPAPGWASERACSSAPAAPGAPALWISAPHTHRLWPQRVQGRQKGRLEGHLEE